MFDQREKKGIWAYSVIQAKRSLGYSLSEYIQDWDSVISTAKYIYREKIDDLIYIKRKEYHKYLKSYEWRKKRREVLRKQGCYCKKCGEYNKSNDIHHLTYDFLGTSEEINFCIVLCRTCHNKVHDK